MKVDPTVRFKGSFWRQAYSVMVVALVILLYGLVAPAARASTEVKIVAVKGHHYPMQYDAAKQRWVTHPDQITIYPGDVIDLSGASFETDDFDKTIDQENPTQVEEFTWTSSLFKGDLCDPGVDHGCEGTSFVKTKRGVQFYVPENFAQYGVTIRMYWGKGYDEVDLINGRWKPENPPAPPQSVVQNDDQVDENFDYENYLAGYGRWVYVDGVRAWSPYAAEADYVPYTVGYNYWAGGVVHWYPLEPWRLIYRIGVWRSSVAYGWVWIPAPSLVAFPVMSYFYTPAGIGWTPFCPRYTYVYGPGWNDGFWLGFRGGLDVRWRFGWTYVPNGLFFAPNIYTVREVGLAPLVGFYNTAYAGGFFGPRLGAVSPVGVGITIGMPIPMGEREFLMARVGAAGLLETPVRTTTHTIIGLDGTRVGTLTYSRPVTPNPMPDHYANYAQVAAERLNSRTPLAPAGAVVVPRTGEITHPLQVDGHAMLASNREPMEQSIPREQMNASTTAPNRSSSRPQSGGSSYNYGRYGSNDYAANSSRVTSAGQIGPQPPAGYRPPGQSSSYSASSSRRRNANGEDDEKPTARKRSNNTRYAGGASMNSGARGGTGPVMRGGRR